MKNTATVIAVLFSVAATCIAYPSRMTQDFQAQTQWHVQAPARGCVEIAHNNGGSTFRSYVCDHNNEACVFSNVERCPFQALASEPKLKRIVNVRARDHVFRYYDTFGTSCFYSFQPDCCPAASIEADDDCKCEELPTGEKVCDPVGCDAQGQGLGKVNIMDSSSDCKCEDLPTGERVCDPFGCGLESENQEKADIMAALLEYIQKN